MICGIYKITNKINNKCYIGQSENIFRRWKEHSKIIDETIFHQAIKEHGLENFIFEILEICSKEELNNRENYWINFFDSCDNGYNMSYGGHGFKTEDSIKRSYPYFKKQVNQYDLEGNFIQSFPSLQEAIEITGISQIGKCCRGERKTAGLFQWRYEKDHSHLEPLNKCNIPNNYGQAVVHYSSNGEFIEEFNSINEAEKNTHYNRITIIRGCKEKRRMEDGSYWLYKKDKNNISLIYTPQKGQKKAVSQFSLDGKFIQSFESLSEASRQTGIRISSISDVCKNKQKTAGKYIWKFNEEKGKNYKENE